jgi:hypothetical protein
VPFRAARVAELRRARYPYSDIIVTRIPDGLRVEVHAADSSLYAVIGSEHSPVLTILSTARHPADLP